MKISHNWLRQYLDTDLSPDTIAELLTNTGLEVEGMERIDTVPGGLRGVVVGQVLRCEPHPNADKLQLTQVDLGKGEPVQIVCGAPNVAAEQKVPVATVGATLYSGDQPLEIKKAKLRGEKSEGMICSESELGLGAAHDGIMVLDAEAAVGKPASEYFQIESDVVWEIGLTPNRTDAMSHYGVARDLRAAMLRFDYDTPHLQLPPVGSFAVASQDRPVAVSIQEPERCYRYAGVSMRGVEVKPSPDWLQNRLRALGLQPINNVVDITNYVLHETGHPLHAFDFQKIRGAAIQVKCLPEGTPFTTLDGKERKLRSEDLMVCDAEGPLVLAGVMGGMESGVNEATEEVFLEAAHFDPVSVRKTAKHHALSSDSSFRYERGIDPEMSIYALKRAATLIRDIAGGSVSMEIRDEQKRKFSPREITLNLDYLHRLIGQELPLDLARHILQWLEIKIAAESGNDWHLHIPAYRHDVTRPADVAEEILRIYGFNAVELPTKMAIAAPRDTGRREGQYREKLSQSLSARGFQEIMNNSLSSAQRFPAPLWNPEQFIPILNPLSQELGILRPSLLPGGLETIAYNTRRQQQMHRIYEWGRSYHREGDQRQERKHLSLWISGPERPENWRYPTQDSDFYSLKQEVLRLLSSLGFSTPKEKATRETYYLEGLQLQQGKKVLATLGQVQPSLLQAADLKQPVFYAELPWDRLLEWSQGQKVIMEELPRYPEVHRDLALLLQDEVKYQALRNAAFQAETKLLREVNLFDVYRGQNLPSGKKSYALRFTLRDDQKTLQEKQVEQAMDRIFKAFQKQFDAQLR